MAGRIFVTGDCHHDFKKFNTKSFPQQKELDKEDYMIICGDFGGIWDGSETKEDFIEFTSDLVTLFEVAINICKEMNESKKAMFSGN